MSESDAQDYLSSAVLTDQLRLILMEEKIFPSPNSVDLKYTPTLDYLHSSVATRPNVAELYHHNSKLTPHMMFEVPENEREIARLREWFFSTSYDMREEHLNREHEADMRFHISDLPEMAADLLRPFTQAGPMADLLYGVDLLVMHDGRLAKLVPESDYLWIVRRVDDASGREQLKEGLLQVPSELVDTAEVFLFLIACPWRYMLFYGPRGYRHTLMDAGRLMAQLEEGTSLIRHAYLTRTQNFYDAVIDQLILMDGIERSTLAVMLLNQETISVGEVS